MPSDAATARWTFERGSGVAGVVAAALMFTSAALGSTPDEGSATDARLLDFYNDSTNQARLYVAALVGFAAGLLFLWFLVGLRDRLARVETSGLPSLLHAAGLVFVILWFLGSIGLALPLALLYSDFTIEEDDVDALRVTLILGNHWLPGAAASTAAVVIGVASFIARRHRLYSRWLAWAGLVVSVPMLASIAGFLGLTLIVLMIWSVATGIWLIRSDPSRATQPLEST